MSIGKERVKQGSKATTKTSTFNVALGNNVINIEKSCAYHIDKSVRRMPKYPKVAFLERSCISSHHTVALQCHIPLGTKQLPQASRYHHHRVAFPRPSINLQDTTGRVHNSLFVVRLPARPFDVGHVLGHPPWTDPGFIHLIHLTIRSTFSLYLSQLGGMTKSILEQLFVVRIAQRLTSGRRKKLMIVPTAARIENMNKVLTPHPLAPFPVAAIIRGTVVLKIAPEIACSC